MHELKFVAVVMCTTAFIIALATAANSYVTAPIPDGYKPLTQEQECSRERNQGTSRCK